MLSPVNLKSVSFPEFLNRPEEADNNIPTKKNSKQ